MVFGHYLSPHFDDYFADRKIRRAILLRDPAERTLSHYNHAMRNRAHMRQDVIEFDEWYTNQAKSSFGWERLYGKKLTRADKQFALASAGHNYMAKFILNAMGVPDYQSLGDEALYVQASDILNGFQHIGKSESMSNSIAALKKMLGKKLNIGTHNKSGGKLPIYLEMTTLLRDYLRKINAVDYRMYNKFCD